MNMRSIMDSELDYYSQTPLYQQLITIIKRSIDSGTLKEGDMLPAEMELCERYGVSRSTVRQAFSALEQEGIIARYRGKGTFVTSPKLKRTLKNLYSFSAEMTMLGLESSSELLTFETIRATGDLTERMKLREGEDVFKFVRLRRANGEPLMLETDFVPVRLCPQLSKEVLRDKPLYNTLEKESGLKPARAVESYDVTTIDANEAELLNTRTGSSAFFVQRISEDAEGVVFEMAIMLVRGDRCRYEVELKGENISFLRKID